MGVLRPFPQLGGAQTASKPAPPGDCAVTVVPPKVATVGLLLKMVTGAGEVTMPFSSIMSTWTTFVSVVFKVTEVVKPDAGSPATWSTRLTGIQVLNGVAGAVVAPMLATTPPRPESLAVARPFASTEATVPSEEDQLKLPTEEVISVPLWNAWAVN